jgi:phosphate transport system permease protein
MSAGSVHQSPAAMARLRARRLSEAAFKGAGLAAIGLALAALVWLVVTVAGAGLGAFYQHYVTLDVALDAATIDPEGRRDPEALRQANLRKPLQDAVQALFPEVTDRVERRQLFAIVSSAGATDALRKLVYANPQVVGSTVTISVQTSDDVDQLLKGKIDRNAPEAQRKVNDRQIAWVDALRADGAVTAKPNWGFFRRADSRDAELAGIGGAIVGSAMTLLVALALSLPFGVGAAIYLEEFAPKNRVTDLIEININNLAAVPSIVFGLLGLAVFLNFFGLPRSAPLVGGVVLSLITLPTIIIATRSGLRSVSPGIVDAALSVGASPVQAVFHHKLPLAMPGILTGSIIGMARALGETAPLLMIGMVAFVTEIPKTLTEPASALPVQIFLWSDSAERAWAEKTSAAIIVLLVMLAAVNAVAVVLRNKFERRW